MVPLRSCKRPTKYPYSRSAFFSGVEDRPDRTVFMSTAFVGIAAADGIDDAAELVLGYLHPLAARDHTIADPHRMGRERRQRLVAQRIADAADNAAWKSMLASTQAR